MQIKKTSLTRLRFHLIFIAIAIFLFTQMTIAETSATAAQLEIEAGTGNIALPWQPPALTPNSDDTSAVFPKTTPSFSIEYSAEPMSVNAPGLITYSVVVKNTGKVPLTGIRISSKTAGAFSGPLGDIGRPGVLDVNEIWTFTGNFTVTQKVIDGNGVDDKNTRDDDGDIDSTVTVQFAETPIPEEASAAVDVIRTPSFTVSKNADITTMDRPGIITYTIVVANTGNVSLTDIKLSDPVLDRLKDASANQTDNTNPQGDITNPGILDVGETWTYTYPCKVTQDIIDHNGMDSSDTNTAGQEAQGNIEPGNGKIRNSVTVDFAQTDPLKASASVEVIQHPQFTVTKLADVTSVDEPETIHFTIDISNTGNLSLTQISISDPLLEDLEGPEGDEVNPGVLDVNETWTFSGAYEASQAVIDGNGVDANNIIDGDGDIDNTVMVDFAETDPPQTAYAPVATDLSITGDIFEKKHRYVHGFLSGTRSYISNLYKTDRDPESCWATLITPGIWATFPSKMKRSVEIITQNASPGGLAIEPFNPAHFQRFQAYILYSPQLEMYHDQNLKAYQDPNLGAGVIDNENIDQANDSISRFTGQDSSNRLTHRVDAMLHYYSGNKLAVRAIDQYKISYDAFSERAYVTDDKYSSNMFNVSGKFDPTDRLQLRLDYSKFCLNYEDNFNRDDDRTDDVYAAYLFFRLTPKTSAFLEYDFADINYDMSSRDSREYRYFGGLRWEMSGKSSGQIKGGFGRKKTDNSPMIDTDADISDISENNWMAAIQIDHNLTSKMNITLNAYRRYDEVLEHRYDFGDFNDFYADYTLAHFAGIKLSWNVVSNIHLNLDTSLFYDKFINSRGQDRDGLQTDRKDYEFALSPSITIDLFKHFSVNGAYIYTDHDSNYPELDYFDHTFFVRASLFL